MTTIGFTEQGVNFDEFYHTGFPEAEKRPSAAGIQTTDYQNFKFNMDIRTNNFLALHSTAEDNDVICGTVYLTSNIKVRERSEPARCRHEHHCREGDKILFRFTGG